MKITRVRPSRARLQKPGRLLGHAERISCSRVDTIRIQARKSSRVNEVQEESLFLAHFREDAVKAAKVMVPVSRHASLDHAWDSAFT